MSSTSPDLLAYTMTMMDTTFREIRESLTRVRDGGGENAAESQKLLYLYWTHPIAAIVRQRINIIGAFIFELDIHDLWRVKIWRLNEVERDVETTYNDWVGGVVWVSV